MRMGTKVHYRSYSPPFNTMRDFNANSGNSWSPFYFNKNENFYNGFLLSSLNGYSEYDKEMLKQTMLEHEATFRKQVYELHRLYSIQKDLMTKFQKNGSSGSSKYEDMSKTFSFTSQVQSEYATNMLPISHLHTIHNSHKKEKSLYNDDIISPINFFERNRQSSSGFCESEALQIVAETDDSFRECPKTMLALHLPDCGYMDDTERLEFCSSSSLNKLTCSGISNGDSDTELKLNLASGSGPIGEDDVCKLNYHHNKSPLTSSIFANEPNMLQSDSFSSQISGPITQKKEDNGLSFSVRSTNLSLQNSFPIDWNCGESAFSNVFKEVKEKPSRGKPCSLNFTTSVSYKERNSIQNEASIQFVHEEDDRFHNRNSPLLGLPPGFSNSLSTALNFESFSAAPSFKGTINVKNFDNPDTSSGLQVRSDMISPLRFENISLSRVSGLKDQFPCQSRSTSQLNFQFTNINLNNEAENFSSASRNRLISQQDLGLGKFYEVYDRKTENATSISSFKDCKTKINQLSDSFNRANLTGPNLNQNLVPSTKCIDLNSVFPNSSENCTASINLEEPITSLTSMSLQEELCSHESLIKQAAEDIIKLSSEKDASQSIISSKIDLHLFAEIATSEENIANPDDLFELMNLRLEETKPDKARCIAQEVESTATDKRSRAAVLLAKPRRGQGRRRRQRKDFQKDILPALTTLSRQETAKDLQAIAGLMKAAGTPWQPETRRRRKTCRNNSAQPRASQKNGQRNCALPVDDGDDGSHGFEIDGQDIVGWGRLTRRCRSQRCHPVSISTTLT